MRTIHLTALALALLSSSLSLAAQEKPAAETAATKSSPGGLPAKIQVVLTEYDGAKKISSLPYTIYLTTQDPATRPFYLLRIGVRVPVAAASKSGDASVQYIDIGTGIDARARIVDDGKYVVELTVDRSSLYAETKDQSGKPDGHAWAPGEAPPGNTPLVVQFRGNSALVLRDGQTQEATVATDPLTGHVLKIEVTLSILK